MGKQERNKHTNKDIKAKDSSSPKANNLRDELRRALAHAASSGWIQNGGIAVFLVGVAFIVGVFRVNGIKAAAITFGIAATAFVWLLVGVVIYFSRATTEETEHHGLLQPADEPMPNNPCGEIPQSALAVFLGRSAAYSSSSTHTVIMIKGERVLSFERVGQEIAISARVFSRDRRIVAEIRRNEFFVNPNNYFRRERPDTHSLRVFDQEGRKVLDVRFLNPRAIRFLGIFNHPAHEVVISETEGLFANTMCFGENKVDVSFD